MANLNERTLNIREVKSEPDNVGTWVRSLQKKAQMRAKIGINVPPSPCFSSHKNMAKELIELGNMYKEGLLSLEEFNIAKKHLLYE